MPCSATRASMRAQARLAYEVARSSAAAGALAHEIDNGRRSKATRAQLVGEQLHGVPLTRGARALQRAHERRLYVHSGFARSRNSRLRRAVIRRVRCVLYGTIGYDRRGRHGRFDPPRLHSIRPASEASLDEQSEAWSRELERRVMDVNYFCRSTTTTLADRRQGSSLTPRVIVVG
jgi:hypothetical protein